MKKLTLYLIAILLTFAVLNAKTFETKRDVKFSIKYSIISSGNPSKVKLVCAIPTDVVEVQKVRSIDFSIKPTRTFYSGNNKYAEFIVLNPKGKTITMAAKMTLYRADLATRLNDPSYKDEKANVFATSEKYIESGNYAIAKKAAALKGATETDTLKNIYSFVNKHITYSGYEGADRGALLAYQTGKGDCTEYADLFIALCRANSIPARYIEGYTTSYGNTPKHNWAEAYTDELGWVQFDATPGNGATATKMENRYIRFSSTRNDATLNNYHYYAYWWWGDSLKVNWEYTVH